MARAGRLGGIRQIIIRRRPGAAEIVGNNDLDCCDKTCGTAEDQYPLVMTNIAMENGPFIDDFPIKTSIYEGFSMAMLNNQMVKKKLIHTESKLSKLWVMVAIPTIDASGAKTCS